MPGNPRFVAKPISSTCCSRRLFAAGRCCAALVLIAVDSSFRSSNIALTSIVALRSCRVQQAYPTPRAGRSCWIRRRSGAPSPEFAMRRVSLLKSIRSSSRCDRFHIPSLTLLISQAAIEGCRAVCRSARAGFVWQIPFRADRYSNRAFFLCPDELTRFAATSTPPLHPSGADRRHFCAASSVRHIPLLRVLSRSHSADGPRVVGEPCWRRISASIHYRRVISAAPCVREAPSSASFWRRVRHHSRQRIDLLRLVRTTR